MKMLFIVTDSEYEPHCLNLMREKGIAGYTIVPNVFGVGKSGAKMGDRYHPGSSVLIMSAIEDDKIPEVMNCLNSCIATRKLCETTHAWVVPVVETLKGG
ncbi:MAG: PG0541 family transporter-associated protein [Acidobacteriota bacterium]|nr:hypothetical protein [Thermoanaerobaculaceae bacterium]